MISAESAASASSFRGVEDLPVWSALALFLVEGRYGSTALRQEWAPYIDALPLQTGGVLEWAAPEIELLRTATTQWHTADQMLEGARLPLTAPPLLLLPWDTTSGAAAGYELSAEELLPMLREAQAGGALAADMDPEAALRWAFGILLSRCIRLPR